MRRSRIPRVASIALIIGLQWWACDCFLVSTDSSLDRRRHRAASPNAITTGGPPVAPTPLTHSSSRPSSSSTALHIWWYGGSETVEAADQRGADSCELVAVRIERTSANSRRIFGEITVPAPMLDVWAILTDYNRLATHVPNLVESRIERATSGGEMGDGQFQCRLFQKGAQKIVGFEFGASVTMDMKEIVMTRPTTSSEHDSVSNIRKIKFKCVDSFFFDEFDGEWKVREQRNTETGEIETVLSYLVDVRPKGPVPVGALEWRIREDVPTNLREVKRAALQVGYEGVMATRQQRQRNNRKTPAVALPAALAQKVQWFKDETMEAYLTD